MTLDQFRNKYYGSRARMTTDVSYGWQCVAFVKRYMYEVYGVPYSISKFLLRRAK